MSARISTEDLDVAILWLESYEGTDADDEGQQRCQKVADWLKAELEDRLLTKIMRDHKVDRNMAKQVLARIRAAKNTEKA